MYRAVPLRTAGDVCTCDVLRARPFAHTSISGRRSGIFKEKNLDGRAWVIQEADLAKGRARWVIGSGEKNPSWKSHRVLTIDWVYRIFGRGRVARGFVGGGDPSRDDKRRTHSNCLLSYGSWRVWNMVSFRTQLLRGYLSSVSETETSGKRS